MAIAADTRCRLCLVTPAAYDIDAMSRQIADALAGGDVASLIVTGPTHDPASLQRAAEAIVPIAEARGVAALVHNDTRIAGRVKADGVHIDSGIEDVRQAVQAAGGKRIVGTGNVRSRHEALEMGELEPDYIFFGRFGGDTNDTIFPAALELAAWWSSVTVIPAMVMGGKTLASVEQAAANDIPFVALSSAVWLDPRGPGAAVAEAAERLAVREPAA
jgi:thiamine-phosphate pyrophosphorylase